MSWDESMRSVDQVAQFLGVSRQLVYKEIKIGKLPAYQFATRVLISRKDLERYLERNRVRN